MKLLNLFILFVIITSCSSTSKNASKLTLNSDEDKTHYALGYLTGTKIQKLNLTDQTVALIREGFKASALKKQSRVDLDIYLANAKHVLRTKTSNQDLKTYYALGYMLGQDVQKLYLTSSEIDIVCLGLTDASGSYDSVVDINKYSKEAALLSQSDEVKRLYQEKLAGTKFLENYLLSNKDAKQTPNGLVYQVLKEGSGKSPSATDTVEVHYHGMLIDGEVFDSSVERGKKISFALNRVIPGWTQGLQLMKEGEKARFIIPSDLAYGDFGAPPKIAPGATLIFEVELYKVK